MNETVGAKIQDLLGVFASFGPTVFLLRWKLMALAIIPVAAGFIRVSALLIRNTVFHAANNGGDAHG